MTKLAIDFPERRLFVRLFGGDVYAVGGAVRDIVRGSPSPDVDILVARHTTTHAAATSTHVVKHHAAPVRHVAAIPAKDRFEAVPLVPLRARTQMRVLVLNGNGVAGAAHAEAARLQGLGYRIGGAANAPRHAYSRSMVMYVPGYVQEARRLSRDIGIRLVAPVDGLTPASLRTARLVVLLGS